MEKLVIRNERESDYRKVEEIHRDAFWNLYVPGCSEHYLAHIMRGHKDFVAGLDYVCEWDGQVIGNIMYTKSRLVDEQKNTVETLTFGPVGIAPAFQRQGIGRTLLEKSLDEAAQMGYKAVVIFGNPSNYVARGFRSSKRYNVCLEGDVFPAALLVKELEPGFFDGRKYYFYESSVFEIEEGEAEAFDKSFACREKAFQPSQEEFYICSHSVVQ